MTTSAVDQRIRSLRSPKPHVDPYRAHGALVEDERRPGGKIERALTIFLAGAECPFTCSFCDLWRWTIDGPTPPGALAKQVADTLESAPRAERLKLYNASNFFDRRAVPDEDVAAITAMSAPFASLTVESHVNTIGASTLELAKRLDGRLEVAVGLETIHPDAQSHLNKRLDLSRFDRAASTLGDYDIDLRVFVLLGAPYVVQEESVEWTVRSVQYAAARGAAVVSIIPVRGGNGEMERLGALGHFVPPTLSQLEESLERSMSLVSESTVVTADLWDADRLTACEECRTERVDRLGRLNVAGIAEERMDCFACEGR